MMVINSLKSVIDVVILSVLSECIETSVNEQFTNYFENNNLLTNHQYGFRKNHSSTYLTLDMFDKLFDSKSIGNPPAIIFPDIKKAFDTVDHKILIDKLKLLVSIEQLYYGLKII